MIEDELRAAFARHEPHAPAVSALRPAIARLASHRRRRRLSVRSGVVAVLALVTALGLPPFIARAPDAVPDVAASLLPAGPLNLLLIGLDPADLAPASPRPRSDTIIVVHIPADRRSVYLISIERDVEVDIPGHGLDKINFAYVLGGEELLTRVVQTITGTPIDGTVTVTLGALAQVTDSLGGIQVCLPDPVVSYHTGRSFPAGCADLDGTAVSDLARQRMGLPVGGYDRDRNVQRILIGIAARAGQLNVLTDADKLADLIGVDGVTVAMPGIDPVVLALALGGVAASNIVGLSDHTFHPTGLGADESLDPVVAPQLFDALRGDTLAEFAAAHPDWVLPMPE